MLGGNEIEINITILVQQGLMEITEVLILRIYPLIYYQYVPRCEYGLNK